MQAYFLVFIGGGLGSICRYGLAQVMREYQLHFPWATFSANALSCIILGILLGLSMKGGMTDSTKILLMSGFCGGFSTFSTFSSETYYLFQSGDHTYAFLNMALSLLVGLFCIFVGLKLV